MVNQKSPSLWISSIIYIHLYWTRVSIKSPLDSDLKKNAMRFRMISPKKNPEKPATTPEELSAFHHWRSGWSSCFAGPLHPSQPSRATWGGLRKRKNKPPGSLRAKASAKIRWSGNVWKSIYILYLYKYILEIIGNLYPEGDFWRRIMTLAAQHMNLSRWITCTCNLWMPMNRVQTYGA